MKTLLILIKGLAIQMIEILKPQAIVFDSVTHKHRKSLLISCVVAMFSFCYDLDFTNLDFLGIKMNLSNEALAVPFIMLFVIILFFLVSWIFYLRSDIRQTRALDLKRSREDTTTKLKDWKNLSTDERNRVEALESEESDSGREAAKAYKAVYIIEVHVPLVLSLVALTLILIRIF